MQKPALHTAIIGGGISGLASAYRALQRGFDVTLFESRERLGGLASSFEYRGAHLERFYHCILPTDDSLLQLIREIGLGDDIVWKGTDMGFMHRSEIYPLNTPLDLLRFRPLGLVDRLRLGMMGLRAGSVRDSLHLDGVTAVDWIKGMIGERAFTTLWKPLLQAKMGDGYLRIPALWLSNRMGREKGAKREERGYLRNGYRSLVLALQRALLDGGARIVMERPVASILRDGDRMSLGFEKGADESFDVVIATSPLIEFQRMSRGLSLDPSIANLELDYQGVISGVFLTEKPLTGFYWMPIVESGATCQGVIEMSNLVPRERSHGLYVNYFANYTHRESELYRKSDDELLELYQKDLATLFPAAAGSVVDRFLFRAPFVEPLWSLGYHRRRPSHSVIPGRLYLACTAQVYPRVNSWDSCCEVVSEMVPELAAETAALPEPNAARRPA